MQSPFLVEVFDKNLARQGFVPDVLDLKVTPRHGAIGSASFSIRSTHPKAADLLADGSRVRISYRGNSRAVDAQGNDVPGAPWVERMPSGPVQLAQAEGSRAERVLTFQVQDDVALLWEMLGWPAPGQPISNQGASTAYDVRSGNAEAVIKGFVTANATRLGLPVVCATNLNRGGTVKVQMRMHPMADRLLPQVLQAGVGFYVEQRTISGVERLVFDVYVPTVYPRTLTEESGVVQLKSWTRTRPTVTRVIVGGQGEGTAREFQSFPDTALEAAWGIKVEKFVDARDTTDPAVFAARAAEALAEGAPRRGFSIALSETGVFRYGGPDGVHVGDQVPIDVGDGLTDTLTLEAAELSYTVDGGVDVTPTVGDVDDPDKTSARLLAAALRKTRDLGTI